MYPWAYTRLQNSQTEVQTVTRSEVAETPGDTEPDTGDTGVPQGADNGETEGPRGADTGGPRGQAGLQGRPRRQAGLAARQKLQGAASCLSTAALSKHGNVGTVVIHAGVNDTSSCQSEALKEHFRSLLNTVISRPLPTYQRGSEVFSRLYELHCWLQGCCKNNGVGYVSNWSAFRERLPLYRRDGPHLSRRGSVILSGDLEKVLHQACLDLTVLDHRRLWFIQRQRLLPFLNGQEAPHCSGAALHLSPREVCTAHAEQVGDKRASDSSAVGRS
ncbi:hypothetical protein AOLI_G00013750 [Acnodon oligacanthus]